jgi:transcriptional regulator with XRE-family HTH domain
MSATTLSATVGRKLQQLRANAGIPLRRLAKNAGVSMSTLKRIEEGRLQPSLGTLHTLATTLGSSVPDLVREAGKPKTGAQPPRDVPKIGAEEIGEAIVRLPGGIDKLETVEAAAVRYALQVSGGNKTAAARLLGIERQAIGRRLRKFRGRERW